MKYVNLGNDLKVSNNSMEFVKRCAPKDKAHDGFFTDLLDEAGILTYLKDNSVVK